MKKFGLALILTCIIIVPIIILYFADRKGAITDPLQAEAEFVYFINHEVTKKLSTEARSLLMDRFREASIDLLKSPKKVLSEKYGNGSFKCEFYNEVLQNEDWYKFSFGICSNGDYYSINITTGLYEKISFCQYKSGNETVLFEHYIPLEQNKFNTIQFNRGGKHLLLILNDLIIFHLLLENEIPQGGIGFSRYSSSDPTLCHAVYAPITDEIKTKINDVIKKIRPVFLVKN